MKRSSLNSTQNTFEIPPDLGHLPNTVGALVPLYRDCIVRFDAAVHARDMKALAAIHDEAEEIVERALSFDRFQGRRSPNNPHGYPYCFNDVADIFQRLTRAVPGAVPLFGQSGRFVASLSITKVRFDVAGLCSIGMSAYSAAAYSFEIRAVEHERAFFSETGYRSFMLCSLEVGERSDNVQAWCLGHLRHWWNGEGGRATKHKLPFIRSTARPASLPRPVPVAEVAQVVKVAAALPVGTQLDLFGGVA
jgi:hypothetical protein